MGTICAIPPPVAPPLSPNTGPRDGSRRASTVLAPSRFMASARPMLVVVLPSPAWVGLIAVTRISLPRCFRFSRGSRSLAMYWPFRSRSSSPSPSFRATRSMGKRVVLWAISISERIAPPPLIGFCGPGPPDRYSP